MAHLTPVVIYRFLAQRVSTAARRQRRRREDARFRASCVLVRERDGNRCRVCHSGDGVEVHHVVYRSRLGSSEPSNLVCLCGGCHRDVHAARLTLAGDAEGLRVTWRGMAKKRANIAANSQKTGVQIW